MAERPPGGVVILAAGASRRMGRPKQLLPVAGQPLLRRVAEAALASGCRPVVVVLGAQADAVRGALSGLDLVVAVNPDWEEGMASSVRAGIQALADRDPTGPGAVIVLGDAPGFSAEHVGRLLGAHRQTGRGLIATRQGGALAPPAYIAACYFPELLQLRGEAGARALFQEHAEDVEGVEGADPGDLDTPEDYAAYLKGRAVGAP